MFSRGGRKLAGTKGMTTALLVVDMQVDSFVSPRHDTVGTVARLNELAARVRNAGGMVVYVQHDGREGESHFPHTRGWHLLPELDKKEEDVVIRKAACDSFLDTGLNELLCARGVDHVIVGGCATDYCVDTTVRRALGIGFRVTVPADAHTTANRPHLDAPSIIRHHNFIWADFIAPNGPAKVVPASEVEP
jgi:nicotinamidase-related amidase